MILLLAGGAAGYLLYSLVTLNKAFEDFTNQNVQLLSLAYEIQYEDLELTSAVKGIMIEPYNNAELDNYNQSAERIESLIDQAIPLLQHERSKEIFAELDQYNNELISLESQIISLARSDKESAMVIYHGDYRNVRTIFSKNLAEFTEIQNTRTAETIERNKEVMFVRSVISFIAIALAIIAGIGVAFTISNSITSRLSLVTTKLKELAQNEGDLTARLEIKSKDEIGHLAQSFNSMMGNIQHLIKEVKDMTVDVAASSEQLTASSTEAKLATDQVTVSIQQVAAHSETQMQGTEESLSALEEMTSTIQTIAESSSLASESSYEASQQADNGNEYIKKSVEQMSTVRVSVESAAQVVQRLEDRSIEINSILEVITAISNQTNLLALNAAIEAARAGEQGKGFAVVADEVRKLAEQSTASASQISELISEILKETSSAVDAMEKGTEDAYSGEEMMNRAGESFDQILSSIKKVSEQIDEVSSASQQIAASSQQVTASIDELASISKETAENGHTVAASSEETLASMEEISSSASSLSEMAEKLQRLVGKFKL